MVWYGQRIIGQAQKQKVQVFVKTDVNKIVLQVKHNN